MTENSLNDTKIFNIFLNWTESITIHGFPNIFRTKLKLVRFMWIIFFLISIGFCFYIISLNIISYLNFDVITKIRVIEKDSLPFPAVTICNTNPFVTDEAFKYVSSFLQNNSIINFTTTNKLDEIFFPENFSKLYLNYNVFRYMASVLSKSNTKEFKQKFSMNFDSFFISCLFSFQPCDQKNWTWYFDSEFGNCYRFNEYQISNEVKKSFQAGKFNGLMLELFVGIPDNQSTLSLSTGAHLFINDNLVKPRIGKGFQVSPGSYSNIIIERIKNMQMPKPYSDCVDNLDTIYSFDSEYYREVFRSNLTYNQIECLNAYIHSKIYERCKCDDMTSNLIIDNGNLCDTFEKQLCSINIRKEITTSNYKETVSKLCPLECESIRYDWKKSEGKYPSASYARDLAKSEKVIRLFENRSNVSLEELRDNILAINIYYETIEQTEITENASYTWDGLIGSIGGTLGLFLGMSLLSFADFIDLAVQIISKQIGKNKTNILFHKK
ncbi:acid-sensing ion channel 1-like [Brachionus plicatilis]|uniref:Acid-sensing ion channel 1-like n=1 Tax=Brachionus plicatilis TaxID=10195 RepID=A0A3M7S9I4_BRAPC|nr:acid-sensing ion channel 1-like [Brachionus plicatilis]